MLLNVQGGEGPLYRRVYQALKSSIRGGRLGPGARLPSTRTLAKDLGVSRNTVMLAYEQLAAEGYLVSRDRSITAVAHGDFVRPAPKASPAPAPATPRLSSYARRLVEEPFLSPVLQGRMRKDLRYDFRYARPAVDEFPREIWRKLLAARARKPSRESLGYALPGGYLPLREALAGYLRRARGLACDAGQVLIVNGSQQGIDLVSRVLLDPGDGVVVEEPHYPGATIPFEAAGAKLIRVPVDAQGLDTARLPRGQAKLAYVTPCHQFPSGVILPTERRLALLDWAARSDAYVVEDDYVSEFRYEGRPLEALQALDRDGRVIYVGTFAKTLLPALRVGYLVLPPALVAPFAAAKWAADRFSPMLAQEALADLVSSGQFERYLRRAGARNAGRRRVLIASLQKHFGDRIEIAGENTGVHLVVWLNDVAPRELGALIERAAGAGVGLYSVAPFFATPQPRAGLLFGYAALTEAEIRSGIRLLAQVEKP
jgi:GntR family transcriptional regulator/MocR family aminotransferase